MPLLGIFSWGQYTTPTGIPAGDLTGDTQPNDPASPGHSPAATTWIGKTFTFNGGGATQIDLSDDDAFFEDGYVETGGAQTLAQDVTIDGTLYPAGSVVENEFSLINASGQEIYVVRINGVNVGFTYSNGEEPTAGETFTASQGLDGSPSDNADGLSSSSEPYVNVVCFSSETQIATPRGPRTISDLRPGDLVTTLDRGPQPILWVRCASQPLDNVPENAKPVLIAAGALGPGRPAIDLIVSPQHRILAGGTQLSDYFGSEVFVPSKSLTALPGIRRMKGRREITWVHFACERHEVVTANGCLSESLLLGSMVLNGFADPERRVLHGIFGPLRPPKTALNGLPARDCLTVQAVRNAIRQKKKSTDLTVRLDGWTPGAVGPVPGIETVLAL